MGVKANPLARGFGSPEIQVDSKLLGVILSCLEARVLVPTSELYLQTTIHRTTLLWEAATLVCK